MHRSRDAKRQLSKVTPAGDQHIAFLMKEETLAAASKAQLDLTLGFFSRVDAKLSVVLALNTGMLAVLGTNSPPVGKLTIPMWISAVFALLLIGTSIFFLYRGAFPKLKGGEGSLVYFRAIE